jgi:hypothetical protein
VFGPRNPAPTMRLVVWYRAILNPIRPFVNSTKVGWS